MIRYIMHFAAASIAAAFLLSPVTLGEEPGKGPPAPPAADKNPDAAPAFATPAQRKIGQNNLKQIALAVLTYENVNRCLPPAAILDKDKKPLLSWRVAILPYIEQDHIYKRFKLDEPWDSAHNKALVPLMPTLFLAPASKHKAADGKTNYLGIRDPKSAFPGDQFPITIASVQDGTTNTVLAVEATDDAAIAWTRPDDYVPAEAAPTKGLVGFHRDGFQVAMVDGSAQMVRSDISAENWKRLYVRDDRMPIPLKECFVEPPKPLFPALGF